MLHIRERKKDVFRRVPVERSHGEVVILALSDSELFFKIRKVKELMTGVEFFIILSVAAFYFAVMSGRVDSNAFMTDAELCQSFLKQSRRCFLAIIGRVGKL